jgi:DeoR/GlpR family transcriptional regulator of sugar metabolism
MSKRNTQQRRHTIISELNAHGEVSVEQLTKKFDISEVTIRKDLNILEQSGLLLRRYGGAVALPKEIIEPKSKKVSIRKEAIAKCAASLIKDHHRIIVDSGRTTSALIQQLAGKTGLVVMTNSLAIAEQIKALEDEPTLLMTGGTWDPHSESFQGQVAEQVLRSYDFDQLFIGADGIDVLKGTTTFNELIGLSRVMAEVAREVIVMVSSDKIGRKIPNVELPWQVVDILITDADIEPLVQQQLTKQGVKLIVAQL